MSEATTTAAAPIDTQHGDDVDIRSIVVWGLVSVFITIISIFGLHAMYTTFANEQLVEKNFDSEYKSAVASLDRQDMELTKPVRWIGTDEKALGVPIDRAMQITLKQYAKAD